MSSSIVPRGSSRKRKGAFATTAGTGSESTPPTPVPDGAVATHDAELGGNRQERIALEAYLMAERRGFAPGHELEDWLAAEAWFEAGQRFSGDRARQG